MIEPEKLGTIRQELRDAIAETGDDPIRWLEERMTAPERRDASATGESEVMLSLRRFLEAAGPKESRRPRARTRS
jgi:hypothetical protein